MQPARPSARFTQTDLHAARSLARGDRQRRWLEELLDHERGLRPGDRASGRWASSVYRRVEAFVWALRAAGYMIEKRPIGTRRIQRFVLTGYSETYGLAAQASISGASGAIDEVGGIHPGVAELSAEQLEALAVLDDHRSSSIEELVEIVKRLVP